MAIVRINTGLRNAVATAYQVAIDAGGAAGTIKIYDGTMPTHPSASPAGTLLGTLTFSYPCAPAPSSGVLTFSAITSATAVATGTARYARIATSAGATVLDCDVTDNLGTGAILLNNTSITSGGPIQIGAAAITVPE